MVLCCCLHNPGPHYRALLLTLPTLIPSLSLCAVPRMRGSGWTLRRWRLPMTVCWTKLSPGAGPSRICTRTAAIRWCALRGNPSSGMYCVYGLLVLAAVHCLALKRWYLAFASSEFVVHFYELLVSTNRLHNKASKKGIFPTPIALFVESVLWWLILSMC